MPRERINLSSTPDRAEAGDPWITGFLTPVCTIRCDSRTQQTTARVGQSIVRQWSDPLAALHWMSGTFWPGEGRWIGYLSYDLGRLFETLPSRAADDLNLPLFVFTYCRPAADRPGGAEVDYGIGDAPLRSDFTREGYESAIQRVLDYIAAGDVFQVNLAQRFTAGLKFHPAEIYRRLVRESPAPYGAYLGYEDFAIVSNSPELFFRVTPDRQIITRPIKGTRPSRQGMDAELRDSIKDQAELNMIVDLERNDLGRVCRVGSVHVAEPRVIEVYPTVYHGVATICGTLREEVGFVDLLRAIFPGGSVTGAPKIRAMQIIDELEPIRRGPYCGAIGYLDAAGNMQFNVAIRTMIAQTGRIHIPVGGGIVADSNPAGEYEETLVKARAMFAAAGIESLSLEK
ncbi:MAG TPA: aminodeoxychorismate synthase component I [Tepidisphaeraceae bacterium]|nr:aminodeoxychorismate synthase component I [Tepidisphaeraceae bacterium]